MVRTARQRRWLSGWLIVTLLFMQLATAAYACPARTAAMAHMPDCHMTTAMDPEQPQLCKAHCQQGNQAVNPAQAGDATTSPVLLTVLDWAQVALSAPAPADVQHELPSGAAPPGSPPLYLALLVLRN